MQMPLHLIRQRHTMLDEYEKENERRAEAERQKHKIKRK